MLCSLVLVGAVIVGGGGCSGAVTWPQDLSEKVEDEHGHLVPAVVDGQRVAASGHRRDLGDGTTPLSGSSSSGGGGEQLVHQRWVDDRASWSPRRNAANIPIDLDTGPAPLLRRRPRSTGRSRPLQPGEDGVERYRFRSSQILTPYNIDEVNPTGARFRRTSHDVPPSSARSANTSPKPTDHMESRTPGQRARPVRRAGTGKPTPATVHGVPSPTRHMELDRRGAELLFQVPRGRKPARWR